MPATATMNQNGGQLVWEISFNNFMMAVYRGILFNSDGVQLRIWDHQRSDDSVPDTFTIFDPPASLVGCGLYWEASVGDPAGKGGAFTATVVVTQDGKEIGRDTVDGVVPLGYGKVDIIGSYLQFHAE